MASLSMRIELPIVLFICTLLVLSPLPWHWRVRNIPTLLLIFWLAVINLMCGINGIMWGGRTTNFALVWCNISTKLTMGTHYAFAALALCVCRNLAQACSPYYTVPHAAQRRTQFIFEIFMCAVLPVIGMALYYVVQRHRFNIIEDFGCTLYMVPFTSVIFFAFFGLGQEAKDEYTKYLCFVKTKILHVKPKKQPVLPIL
ncbi:unnamed protein product [Rhizoctonia solani]|uniref:Uncharacterized protein n=1 Tax=Rhizoctonia solani TaxID=456999 RepID=A0A8H2X4H7_9AGAM|nr:unnamed protein product [Rhizoctonia solani]